MNAATKKLIKELKAQGKTPKQAYERAREMYLIGFRNPKKRKTDET